MSSTSSTRRAVGTVNNRLMFDRYSVPPSSSHPLTTTLFRRDQPPAADMSRGRALDPQMVPPRYVYTLLCKHCQSKVCVRAMKAILLSDTKIELYSTDTPSSGIQLMDKNIGTQSCHCIIRDVACLGCGNIIGYHVVSPCTGCLKANNNGHFWMFHSSACQPQERMNGCEIMVWSKLPRPERDGDFAMGMMMPYDQLCR